MSLIDPTSLSDWLRPHSIAWYKQLSNFHGKYKYTWNSTITDCNGELIFDKEVNQIITNKKVLDVGCGHEFSRKTLQLMAYL
ncbi:hypothetical protein KDN24_17040 [Bacillus sp. Bva_UNVM-123]|uniref:hypothetical protein n=1 Tax=Bacillus sp. Bva_UNVM-123 TaxID=2829798 RepID=UPI00391F1899